MLTLVDFFVFFPGGVTSRAGASVNPQRKVKPANRMLLQMKGHIDACTLRLEHGQDIWTAQRCSLRTQE